jgi:ribonuclease T2
MADPRRLVLDRFDPIPGPNYTQGWDPRETVEPFTGGDISTPTLQYFGKYDLLDWMNKRWVSNVGENYVFWQHEFSKHAVSVGDWCLEGEGNVGS